MTILISPRNEKLKLLVRIKFLNLFLYSSLKRNWKIYWSEQSFTGIRPRTDTLVHIEAKLFHGFFTVLTSHYFDVIQMVKKIIMYIHKLLSSYQPSKIHTISSYIYELISNHVRNTLYMYYMKPNLSVTWCLDVAVMDRNKTFCSTACQVRFHTHFRVRGMLIIEDPTVIMKCRTAIKALFFHFNVCLSVKLDGLSCSFTSISFHSKQISTILESQIVTEI